MNRFAALLITSCMLLSAGAIGQVAKAQTEPTMTETHIEHIRQNCSGVQSTLNQLHASDALLRVNHTQLYVLISTKLMAPLNSRIALNRMDGLKMTATTMEYDRQWNSFRGNYQKYDEAMDRTGEIRCTDRPVAFYDSLKDAREKRKIVHGDILALNTLLQTYKTNFEEFAKGTQKDAG